MTALALAGSAAFAPKSSATIAFDETFETYALGDVDGQGGWVTFGGPLTADVVNTIASGGAQSLAFATSSVPPAANQYGSDYTLDLAAPITSGQLVFSFDIYQPTGFDGRSNAYISRGITNAPDLNFDPGMNLIGDGATGMFSIEGLPTTVTPILFDQWVSVLVNIDLDGDTAVASYGGTEIFNGAWNRGGATPTQYQGLNIWANGSGVAATTFNIDNLRLESIPEPSGVALLGLGVIGVAFRRRRV